MGEHIDGCVRSRIKSRSTLDDRSVIDGSSNSFSTERKNWKVGIIGLGSVGKALSTILQNFHEVVGYDIIGNYRWEPIKNTDLVFVCVQTPELEGRLDCSHVEDVVERLSLDRYPGIVVVKSTLRVGFMEHLSGNYPDLKLVYSPEFMSEKNAVAWTANPDRIVLSGKEEDVSVVESLYFWVPETIIIRTDYRSAEVGKLAHNAYIALKVTFTNTMEAISLGGGANVDVVMRIVYTDRRIRNSAHFIPHLGPYGGKCVPKDTRELINAYGGQARLLKVADEINNSLLALKELSSDGKIQVVGN